MEKAQGLTTDYLDTLLTCRLGFKGLAKLYQSKIKFK